MLRDPEVRQAVDQYQLGLPRTPPAGRSGELLGRGVGSSLEFQEYRTYLPGDDLRHVDWAAYARSDALMVRLFREEISPRTDILLDRSTSMAVHGGAKDALAARLTAMFALLAGRLGGQPRMLVSRDEQPVTALSLDGLAVELSRPPGGAGSLAEALYAGRIPLSRQGVRIVISDFLFPLDPGRLVRQLATGASTLWIIQVLSDWEQQPTYLGGRRLVDVESGQEIDLLLQRQMVTEYLSRLQRVQQDLREAARRHQATFLTVTAERGLAETCRQDLCTVGVLRVE